MRKLISRLWRPSPEAQRGQWSQTESGLYGTYEQPAARVTVTETTSLGLSAYWDACRILAEDIASATFRARELEGGRVEPAVQPGAVQLLEMAPNDLQSSFAFVDLLQFWAAAWGNGYAEIERAGNGDPLALHPLEPWQTGPTWDNGRFQYAHYDYQGTPTYLEPRDVFHVRGPGGDRYRGWSVARLAKETLGTALATERYAGAFFGAGTATGGIVTHPQQLSDKARENLRREFERMHAGPEHAHRTMVLEEGVKYDRTAIPAEDAQLLESRKMTPYEVARLFRMPPHKLAALEGATFSNINAEQTSYVVGTLQPWAKRWAAEANLKLVTTAVRVYLDVTPLQMADIAQRDSSFKAGIDGGWLSPNEVRMQLNMPSIGPAGDVYRQPLNHAYIRPGADRAEVPNDEVRGHMVATVAAMADDVAARLAERETKAADRISRKAEDERGDAFGRFFEQTAKAVQSAGSPLLRAAEAIGGDDLRDRVHAALATYAAMEGVSVDPDDDRAAIARARGDELAATIRQLLLAQLETEDDAA